MWRQLLVFLLKPVWLTGGALLLGVLKHDAERLLLRLGEDDGGFGRFVQVAGNPLISSPHVVEGLRVVLPGHT